MAVASDAHEGKNTMPVYRLGPSKNGGFRSIHSPDPMPTSRIWSFLAYVLLVSSGIGGCSVICSLMDARDRESGSGSEPGDALSILE